MVLELQSEMARVIQAKKVRMMLWLVWRGGGRDEGKWSDWRNSRRSSEQDLVMGQTWDVRGMKGQGNSGDLAQVPKRMLALPLTETEH